MWYIIGIRSSLCRQMVTDVDGKLAVFNIDGAYASLTITGSDDINVAIVSFLCFWHENCYPTQIHG